MFTSSLLPIYKLAVRRGTESTLYVGYWRDFISLGSIMTSISSLSQAHLQKIFGW